MIYIIIGGRGAGKTTLVSQLVHCAWQHGWRVTGIITRGEWRDGEKLALYAHDIATGEQRLLAQRQNAREPWKFVDETLAWGNGVFARAVPTDVLIVDELGPLEFVEGRGWTGAFEATNSGQYRIAFVVVRPELVEHARQRFPHATPIDVQTSSGLYGVPPEAAQ